MENNNDINYSDYEFMEDNLIDDEIRVPDEVYADRLIDTRNEEEIEMEKIINESILLAEKNNEEKNKEFLDQIEERKNKYLNIINKFKKLSKYDKEIKEIFELIDWIYEYYINMQLEYYTYDKETYDKIFNIKLLKQMRFNDNEIELLKTLINYQ